LLIVLFYVLLVCKCVLLPPGVNPIAVKKYIISYHIVMLWQIIRPLGIKWG